MENILSTQNVNLFIVFIEGILSFLSPCVLPLIPIYISYLAGNGKQVDENGNIIYKRKIVFFHTLLFVLGISFAFFILGMSFSALGNFFQSNKRIFTIIAGILILLMGLIQIGFLKIPILEKEYKLNKKWNVKKMTPLLAFFMGFTFSFAWTPCIGPALASVLMLASNSQSILQGNLLVLLYTIGFAIPFLLLGLFTTQVLNFLKNKQKIVQYTIKISAVILIIVGILTLSGGIEKITTFFTQLGNNMIQNSQNSQENNSIISGTETQTEDQSESNKNSIPAIDFTLTDQYGKEHNLSDYKGKVIFLNFWTTWCTYCKQELPELEELYQKYGKNEEDVVFLGITSPSNEQNPYAQDIEESQIKEFISQNNLTFPMLFDITGEVYNKYYIYSFPTSFLINQKGEVEWYSPGMLPKEQIESEIIRLLEK